MWTSQEEMMGIMKASQERMEALMGVSISATEACLERKKPTPEETANVTAHPGGSNGVTREKTIGATEGRSRDRRQAIRRRGRPKKRTQGDSGSRQKLAAAHRRLTA
jgi:hypothetical protein